MSKKTFEVFTNSNNYFMFMASEEEFKDKIENVGFFELGMDHGDGICHRVKIFVGSISHCISYSCDFSKCKECQFYNDKYNNCKKYFLNRDEMEKLTYQWELL